MTYSIAGGADMARFAIDSGSGALTFASAPDFESATDANSDNTYEVIVLVSDGQGLTDQQTIQVTVTDVDEFDISGISDTDAGVDQVAENATTGTAVGITALASDADGTDTISYALDDSAGGRFAIDSGTGVVTVASALDRESAAAHTITIRATSTDGSTTTRSYTINVLDVDEFDTTAVSDTDVTADAVNENVSTGTAVGITAFSQDLDATTNTITYSLDDSAGGLFAIDGTTGIVTTASGIDYESTGSSLTITVRATSADGSSATQSYSVAVNDLDEFDVTPITDTNTAANTIDENDSIGTSVGITAFSEDLDGTNNAVTYSLDDSAGGLFAINSNTGVVATASAIDFETVGSSLSVTVRATSADSSTTTQSYSITVNDVDEFDVTPIVDNNATPDLINENVAIGTAVGITAFSEDLDGTTNTITYSLDSDAGGLLTIDSGTGVVTTAAAVDFESVGGSLSITTRATSADGSTTTQSYAITVNDVDEFDVTPIVDSNTAPDVINENVSVGTAVGITAFSEDLDGTTNTITYSLDSDAGGLFTIDSSTGVVTTAAAVDFESVGGSLSIVVRATSADGSTTTQGYAIGVNDLNDNAPIVTMSQAFSVLEHAGIGTSVGFVAATDADTVGTFQNWSILSGNADGIFSIDSSTGEITVVDTTNLDHESTPTYHLTVSVEDGSNTSAAETVSISVIDENDTPVFVPVTPFAIDENAASGMLAGFVAATDQDVADVLTYSIVSGLPGQPFAVDPASGAISVADGSQLDFETTTSFTLQLRVTDSSGATDTQIVTIDLNDINEAPTDIGLGGGSVAENSAIGTVVGSVTAADADVGDIVTWSLTDDAGGRFAIDFSSGQITVAAGHLLNFEANNAHTITILATDSGSLTYSESFVITVTDVNEAPEAFDDSFTGDQLTAIEVTAGVITANDFDIDGDAITVQLISGPTNGSLQIDADGSFVYMPAGSFSGIDEFTYIVTDGVLGSGVATVTLEVQTTVTAPPVAPADPVDPVVVDNSIVTEDDTGGSDSEADSETETETEESTENDSTTGDAIDGTQGDSAGAEELLEQFDVADPAQELLRRTSSEMFIAVFLDDVPEAGVDADEVRVARHHENRASDDASAAASFLFNQVTTANPFLNGYRFQLNESSDTYVPSEQVFRDFVMDKVVVGSTAAVSTSVSVGYAVWLLRGGSLLTTFLSSMPAWQSFDPLPVLDSFEKEDDSDDDESLLTMVT